MYKRQGDGHTSPYKLQPGSGKTVPVLNDVYGWIYGDLVTAYAYGYWGGKYGNDSSAFDGKPAFNDARSTADPFIAWSLWQQAIWKTSDSYGMSLGERFSAAGKSSPLIGTGQGAETMQVTMKNGCSNASGKTGNSGSVAGAAVAPTAPNGQAADNSATAQPEPGQAVQSAPSPRAGAAVAQPTGKGTKAKKHHKGTKKKHNKKHKKH